MNRRVLALLGSGLLLAAMLPASVSAKAPAAGQFTQDGNYIVQMADEPVVAYDVATVRMAVRTLREQGLLRTVHRTGERSDKHQHLLDSALTLSPGQVALLAALLLRGPQTLAELRAHTERLHAFDSLEHVEDALTDLIERDEALVRRHERQPGHKEARYGQLLVEAEHAQVEPPTAAPTLAALSQQIALLRAEVAEVRSQVDRLRQQQADRD